MTQQSQHTWRDAGGDLATSFFPEYQVSWSGRPSEVGNSRCNKGFSRPRLSCGALVRIYGAMVIETGRGGGGS